MASNITIIVYPAKDLEKSKKFYSTYLQTEPYADAPWYVGYKIGDLEIGLDPHSTTTISYIDTDDIAADLDVLESLGAEIVKPSTDVGGGLHIAQVSLDGVVMGLRQR